jgi:glycosyltransferase involved in cell wall biosynthesis
MRPDVPEISVVIPTHNRGAYITQTLDALATQTYPSDRMEVVLVADGCQDDTADVARRYAATSPYALRLVEQPGSGPAKARNAGASQARGKILLFLDDDIVAMPQLVAAHVAAHAAGPKQVVIGYLPTHLYGQKGYFRAMLRRWWEDFFNRMREPGHRFTYQDLLTGNVSLERSLFASLGGFDVSFRCHEDWEFGYRLLKAGAQFVYEDTAAGHHHERTAMERSFRRKTAEGIADVQFGKLHPELRTTLLAAGLNATCYPARPGFRAALYARLSQRIRAAALYRPAAGDRAADAARRLLDVMERLRIRYRWSLLLDALMAYWYWRGIGQALPTVAAVEEFLAGAERGPDEIFPTVDLEGGIAQAEEWIDRVRPRAARVLYGENVIGIIYPQPGAENLRGVHLRAALARETWWPLIHVLIAEKAVDTQILSPEKESYLFEQERKNVPTETEPKSEPKTEPKAVPLVSVAKSEEWLT